MSALEEVEDKDSPPESESVLGVDRHEFPVNVSVWVLVESCNVLEHSPSLGCVTGLSSLVHKFAEVAIGFFGQGSKDKGNQISVEGI